MTQAVTIDIFNLNHVCILLWIVAELDKGISGAVNISKITKAIDETGLPLVTKRKSPFTDTATRRWRLAPVHIGLYLSL